MNTIAINGLLPRRGAAAGRATLYQDNRLGCPHCGVVLSVPADVRRGPCPCCSRIIIVTDKREESTPAAIEPAPAPAMPPVASEESRPAPVSRLPRSGSYRFVPRRSRQSDEAAEHPVRSRAGGATGTAALPYFSKVYGVMALLWISGMAIALMLMAGGWWK